LTEYFGRLNQRSTRRNDSLPDHIHPLSAPAAALCDRIRHMRIDPDRLAEQEARQTMAKRPGPLDKDWTPDGLTRRQVAAARATQLIVKMRREGETASLARPFDRACDVIDDGLGAEIRDVCFHAVIDDSEPRHTLGELHGSTLSISVRTR
jgi:hypothetical protein